MYSYLLKFNLKKLPLACYVQHQNTENTETFMKNERKGLCVKNSMPN